MTGQLDAPKPQGSRVTNETCANIDVNIADSKGRSAVHMAGLYTSIGGLMLLLSHQSLTDFTLNQKYNNGDTLVMLAVRRNQLEHLALLAADPRVDLDTTDKEGRSLEEVARWDGTPWERVPMGHPRWVFS